MRLKVKEEFKGHVFRSIFEGVPLVLTPEPQEFTPRQVMYLNGIWAEYLEEMPNDPEKYTCRVIVDGKECGKVVNSANGMYLHKKRMHGISE